ncbi:hypothetical protein BC826DRAFT_1187689 [Russula brevipes]|nr:hypothetical protein BC826DRAFT_1187689 [Russula brevipes]
MVIVVGRGATPAAPVNYRTCAAYREAHLRLLRTKAGSPETLPTDPSLMDLSSAAKTDLESLRLPSSGHSARTSESTKSSGSPPVNEDSPPPNAPVLLSTLGEPIHRVIEDMREQRMSICQSLAIRPQVEKSKKAVHAEQIEVHDELVRSAVAHVCGAPDRGALPLAHAHLEHPACVGAGKRHGLHGLQAGPSTLARKKSAVGVASAEQTPRLPRDWPERMQVRRFGRCDVDDGPGKSVVRDDAGICRVLYSLKETSSDDKSHSGSDEKKDFIRVDEATVA